MLRSIIAADAGAMLLALLAQVPAAAQDKPPLIVGAIYVGSVNDYGYNRSMKDGLDEMKKNIPGLKLIEAENVPETAESERIMEGMIQQGAKLIFATSFGQEDSSPSTSPRPIRTCTSSTPAAGCRRRISATSSAPRSRPGIQWALPPAR